jgi:uncharacterized protein (DUF1499 family)
VRYTTGPTRTAMAILAVVTLAMMSDASASRLQPCPARPNCVSSEATDPEHRVEPIHYNGSAEEALLRLRGILSGESRTRVVESEERYLHAEVRSLVFRFVDDLEFLLQPDGLIQVRSAARSGYSDLGVNRRRVERIRQRFQASAGQDPRP